MPPKAKFTKDEIIKCTVEMVRNHGAEIISARNIALALGTSTAPIFTAFESIDELICSAKKYTMEIYKEKYLADALRSDMPFKATGRNYVRFAKEEPELFKFVFMEEGNTLPTNHYLPSGDPTSSDVLAAFTESYEIDTETAKTIYNHLSVYTYGLAVLFANGCCVFTMDDVDKMLSEMFLALKLKKELENE